MKVFPEKLKAGDGVRVIAPAMSASILSEEVKEISVKNLEKLGLTVSFGAHIDERNNFDSSSIESRINDLHAAFTDSSVKAVITSIGGYNSNQLLRYIDWDLIAANPKILCGYSDITSLSNSLYAKAGLVTYSGMHFSTFGQKHLQDYNVEYFRKCLFSDNAYEVVPSERWSDDQWYLEQDKRNFVSNEGWWILNEGEAHGTSLGGNLATFRLLYGTEYMPDLSESVLFIEDDHYTDNDSFEFDRNLQSLMHQKDFNKVKGVVIGRFQRGSEISKEILTEIIKSKQEFNNLPVIANVDFGHTDPLITFPIGGDVSVRAGETSSIEFLKH